MNTKNASLDDVCNGDRPQHIRAAAVSNALICRQRLCLEAKALKTTKDLALGKAYV